MCDLFREGPTARDQFQILVFQFSPRLDGLGVCNLSVSPADISLYGTKMHKHFALLFFFFIFGVVVVLLHGLDTGFLANCAHKLASNLSGCAFGGTGYYERAELLKRY